MFISIAREAQAGDTGVDRSLGNQGRGGDQGGDDYMASVSSREEMVSMNGASLLRGTRERINCSARLIFKHYRGRKTNKVLPH